jgi:hypothetical protein
MALFSDRNWRLVLWALPMVALILYVWFLPGKAGLLVDIRIISAVRSNKDIFVSLVLSNRTTRTVNVVDDKTGGAAFILDTGERADEWVGTPANTLKIDLKRRASITNRVFIANAPPRFRLKPVLRDLTVEARVSRAFRYLPRFLAIRVLEWYKSELNPEQPASDWIRR